MTNEMKKNYNEWYWNAIAIPAMNRLLERCKTEDRSLQITASRDNLIPILKYLKRWEHGHYADENIKRDLAVIRNFEEYETLVAA